MLTAGAVAADTEHARVYVDTGSEAFEMFLDDDRASAFVSGFYTRPESITEPECSAPLDDVSVVRDRDF